MKKLLINQSLELLHFSVKEKVMQKKWYMIYTKPNCEKKVSALLSKNKIENLSATICRQAKHLRKIKFVDEPLFAQTVFANLCEEDFLNIKTFKNIIGVVHWLNKPVTIKSEEIDAIREFTQPLYQIKLEKTCVDITGTPGIVDNSSFLIKGNTVSVKNDFVTVNLPSLGFIMKAEYIRKTSEDKPSILSAQSLQAGSNEKSDVNYQNTVVGK